MKKKIVTQLRFRNCARIPMLKVSKSQKAIFGIINSSKKQTKDLKTILRALRIIFVVFWKN